MYCQMVTLQFTHTWRQEQSIPLHLPSLKRCHRGHALDGDWSNSINSWRGLDCSKEFSSVHNGHGLMLWSLLRQSSHLPRVCASCEAHRIQGWVIATPWFITRDCHLFPKSVIISQPSWAHEILTGSDHIAQQVLYPFWLTLSNDPYVSSKTLSPDLNVHGPTATRMRTMIPIINNQPHIWEHILHLHKFFQPNSVCWFSRNRGGGPPQAGYPFLLLQSPSAFCSSSVLNCCQASWS